ncbi:MAG: 7-carboxy-7-deazaguanine synthase QueE [Chloroflexota bacterium]|nr:7-carboxy-7-deazaguanine synthase QueE [Chloroflexota bacterium]MEC9287056.1 7-carboxy-7-deazaguanine synthase QueE [Chloroflexota bacterium]
MLRLSRQSFGKPEIFHSLQGEGASIGAATVFLRLALCNLSCTWCDTKYTWDWENYNYKEEVMALGVEEVQKTILSYDCPHLVITGGEPMLQQMELIPLVSSLKQQGFYFEVETNGTIPPLPEMERDIDQWNVSPKLGTSGNREHRRLVPSTLESFSSIPGAYFKFVIVEPQDIEEVCELAERYDIPPQRIILLPEGRKLEVLRTRNQWVSEACVKHGFRFSPRLHILLWGDERWR